MGAGGRTGLSPKAIVLDLHRHTRSPRPRPPTVHRHCRGEAGHHQTEASVWQHPGHLRPEDLHPNSPTQPTWAPRSRLSPVPCQCQESPAPTSPCGGRAMPCRRAVLLCQGTRLSTWGWARPRAEPLLCEQAVPSHHKGPLVRIEAGKISREPCCLPLHIGGRGPGRKYVGAKRQGQPS